MINPPVQCRPLKVTSLNSVKPYQNVHPKCVRLCHATILLYDARLPLQSQVWRYKPNQARLKVALGLLTKVQESNTHITGNLVIMSLKIHQEKSLVIMIMSKYVTVLHC